MPEVRVPLMLGDDVADNVDYRDALPLNYTAVVRPIRGTPAYLLAHPGLTQYATGLGFDRAGYWNERQRRHFRVSGEKLIEVALNGLVTDLGPIQGTAPASMVHSFNTQSIVSEGRWWLYDGTTLVESVDPDLGAPTSHTWIDNYYFFCDSESLFHTNATDETAIDPLKYATSEFSPDPSLAVAKTSDNQVIVFNRYSTEYFENRASANFAFSRIQSKATKCGAVGSFAWAELGTKFFVLGSGRDESNSIHQISGGQYGSIATREIDKIIATYTDDQLADAALETRVQDRDQFLIVRLPNDTLVFNATAAKEFGVQGAWTRLQTTVNEPGPWRGAHGVFYPDVGWIYGDIESANIGRLDETSGAHFGQQLEYILSTPFIQIPESNVHEIELDVLPGHQVDDGDITVALSTSYEGVTHSQEHWELYGEADIYDQRLIFRRLGHVKNFIGFRFRLVTGERTAFSNFRVKYA